ncbi:MAG: hypothetical protein ABFD92_21510 [Planctomycetaceae bacterium]
MAKPKLEAQPAYESAHMVATDLLAHIGELLQDMPAPDGEVTINWGHVGSLAEVNGKLAEIIAFLTR